MHGREVDVIHADHLGGKYTRIDDDWRRVEVPHQRLVKLP